MKIKSITLSVVAATVLAGAGIAPALAQGVRTPHIDNQQENIHARIEQGVRRGAITQQEARRLYQRERSLDLRAARAKSDGRVSANERAALQRDLASLRADVDRKLMNRQTVHPRS
jgi:hypothetical protein